MIVEYESIELEIRRQVSSAGLIGHEARLKRCMANLSAKVNFEHFCNQMESCGPESLEWIERWLSEVQDSAAAMRQVCAIVRAAHDRRRNLRR